MWWFNKKEVADLKTTVSHLTTQNENLEKEVEDLKATANRLAAQNKSLPSELYTIRDDTAGGLYCIRQNGFFSTNESKLFKILSEITATEEFKNRFGEGKYHIFPKVRLIDIVEMWSDAKIGGKKHRAYKLKLWNIKNNDIEKPDLIKDALKVKLTYFQDMYKNLKEGKTKSST
jgi:hypothetical protein